MAIALSRLVGGSSQSIWPVVTLFLLLLVSLLILAGLVNDSALFGRYQLWLLGFNLLLLLALIVLALINIVRLVRRRLQQRPGARLATKLVVLFTLFALMPAMVVYTFSAWMVEKGIDSWFDIEVESALSSALDLSRYSLDAQLNQYHRQLQPLVQELADAPDDLAAYLMNANINTSGASELLLLGSDKRIIASVSAAVTPHLLPDLPSDVVLMQIARGETYMGIDAATDGGLYARLVFALSPVAAAGESRILQVLYPIPQRVNTLAASVQKTYRHYDRLSFLRSSLKQNFIIVLTLVLMLAGVYAVWVALFSTKKLMHPILKLTLATQSVAAGELDTKIESAPRDDLGALVDSFNRMTRHLSEARDTSLKSQEQLENQRAYLHTVLANISSGVISLDQDLHVRTVNQAVAAIIGTSRESLINVSLADVSNNAEIARFYETIKTNIDNDNDVWEQELNFPLHNQYIHLICRGTKLPNGGYVIVLNDVTQIVQAQRETAWGEVARHLAHEIKNPLTPIQLSAEQLARKLTHKVAAEDSDFLHRSTHTIIEQVKAMKEMVDEFSQYSRPAPPQFEAVDVNQLAAEIVDLYRSGKHCIEVDLSPQELLVSGDKSRLRQLLHNLLKNALEAVESSGCDGSIMVATRSSSDNPDMVEIEVRDNGPGFSDTVIERLFEPYSTTKPKGRGLGLAIVKKIVEEHDGTVRVFNLETGGAAAIVKLWWATVLKESKDG